MSYRIGERPWRSSSQPTPFIIFWQVLTNNSWTSNKHNEKKNKNKKTNEHRTWWRKYTGETACLCTQMSGSNLSEGICVVVTQGLMALLRYHRGSQTFFDYVPLQHFDRWACTLKISFVKKSEENKNIFTNKHTMDFENNIRWYTGMCK